MFRDRQDAANKLARALDGYRGQNPLVLAIPRGAVPMAKIIAEALDGELDVVLVRKLRAPGNPEFAIGSVDETGWTYLADYAAHVSGGQQYIEAEKAAQLDVMRERRASYPSGAPAAGSRRACRHCGGRWPGDRRHDDRSPACTARKTPEKTGLRRAGCPPRYAGKSLGLRG